MLYGTIWFSKTSNVTYINVGSNAVRTMKFNYRTQYYIPYRVAWSLPLFWGVFESFQTGRIALSISLGFICILVLTTHYGLGVNEKQKTYRDYLWVIGIRTGQIKKFEKIEYLFAKKNKLTQGGYFSSLRYSFQRDQYDGFIKFDEQSKIHLATRDDKKELMKVLNRIANDLKLEVVDYSIEKNGGE